MSTALQSFAVRRMALAVAVVGALASGSTACGARSAAAAQACDGTEPCPQGQACDFEQRRCVLAPGTSGSACASAHECNPPLTCDTRVPGGYCSRDCTPCPLGCEAPESAAPCPAGCVPANEALCPDQGRCVTIALAGAEENRCLAPCRLGVESACRTSYRCKPVAGEAFGLCLP